RLRAFGRPPFRGPSLRGLASLVPIERADHHVVSVRIAERELHGSCGRIQMGLLLESSDEGAGPSKRRVEIIDAKEQQQTVAGCRVIGARQRRMIVRAPLVEAEQDRSIGIEDLTPVVMSGTRSRLAEQLPVPIEARRHVLYPYDRPRALHRVSLMPI